MTIQSMSWRESSDDWVDEWLAVFKARSIKKRIDQVRPNNSECKNCGVKLLKVHVGTKWCGDCDLIPFSERDGYYYKTVC